MVLMAGEAEEGELHVRDGEGDISPLFVAAVVGAVNSGEQAAVQDLTYDLHEADMADLIAVLPSGDREALLGLLGTGLNYQVLTELEESVRDDVIDVLPAETLAEAIGELDSDDAVYLLEDLGEREQIEILSRLPEPDREAVKRSLDYPEDSAGRLMQSAFVAVPPFWTVGQTIDYMRTAENLPDNFFEIFIVGPGYHLIGTIPVSRILRTRRAFSVQDIMDADRTLIPAEEDQEDVAHRFERYNLVSAAVRRLVGVITIDDVVDVIQEEASEDIRLLGGVGGEGIADTVWETARRRFIWLLANLGASIAASLVISLFDAAIGQMVALAVLMPIVASMGGNAGTQTMTVAVRAIATRDLVPLNAGRIVTREILVGLLNGVAFAVILGAVAFFWFDQSRLGVVIAIAMVVNMLVAGISGILVPLALDKLDIDPAIASSVFVTTVTDVVGFFAFLGLAALWLI